MSMRKKTKWLAAGIMLSMLVSLFAGCGDSSLDVNTENVQKSDTQEGKVFDKEMTINMWYTGGTDYTSGEEPDENLVESWLEEQTNVVVEGIIGNGGGTADAKLPQLLAADALPEIVISTDSTSVVRELAGAGKVYALTEEMIKEYAPNIWEKVPATYWENYKIDGKIYAIPSSYAVDKEIDPTLSDEVIEMYNRARSGLSPTENEPLAIRDDILKMIYPDLPDYNELIEILNEEQRPIGEECIIPITSPEEYVEFFYKIKDLNLSEGNMPVYTFGFNGGDNWMALAFLGPELSGSRLYYYTGAWDFNNKEIFIPLVTDDTKEMARTINQMVRDGVIEGESLVQTQAQFDAKVLNGNYAIIFPSYVGVGQLDKINESLEEAGKDFRYRTIYANFYNLEEYPMQQVINRPVDRFSITDSVTEEELPQILNWLDTQYSDEFEEVFNWGPKEAELYVENEDGTRQFVDEEWNKYFRGEETEITLSDLKGISNSLCTKYCMLFDGKGEYSYGIVNNVTNYVGSGKSGFAFAASDEACQVLEDAPPYNGWEPMYAEIPEVITFWDTRQQWEDAFSLVYAAKTNEEFEEKWQAAVDNLYSLVDIEAMEEQMTEIAREYAAENGIE